MAAFALRVVPSLLLVWLFVQLSVTFKMRRAVARTAEALRTSVPAADTPPLTELRIQLTELGFTLGPTTTINKRVLSMIGFRADGIIADNSDTTRPNQPASTGFLTVFEGGGLLATQRRRHLPVPDGDVVQVLPDAPVDELLTAHVRGCRLMERAGHRAVPVPDHPTAQALVLHEIDRIGLRLRRTSSRDRARLLRAQLGWATPGRLLTTHESLPTPPVNPLGA